MSQNKISALENNVFWENSLSHEINLFATFSVIPTKCRARWRK